MTIKNVEVYLRLNNSEDSEYKMSNMDVFPILESYSIFDKEIGSTFRVSMPDPLGTIEAIIDSSTSADIYLAEYDGTTYTKTCKFKGYVVKHTITSSNGELQFDLIDKLRDLKEAAWGYTETEYQNATAMEMTLAIRNALANASISNTFSYTNTKSASAWRVVAGTKLQSSSNDNERPAIVDVLYTPICRLVILTNAVIAFYYDSTNDGYLFSDIIYTTDKRLIGYVPQSSGSFSYWQDYDDSTKYHVLLETVESKGVGGNGTSQYDYCPSMVELVIYLSNGTIKLQESHEVIFSRDTDPDNCKNMVSIDADDAWYMLSRNLLFYNDTSAEKIYIHGNVHHYNSTYANPITDNIRVIKFELKTDTNNGNRAACYVSQTDNYEDSAVGFYAAIDDVNIGLFSYCYISGEWRKYAISDSSYDLLAYDPFATYSGTSELIKIHKWSTVYNSSTGKATTFFIADIKNISTGAITYRNLYKCSLSSGNLAITLIANAAVSLSYEGWTLPTILRRYENSSNTDMATWITNNVNGRSGVSMFIGYAGWLHIQYGDSLLHVHYTDKSLLFIHNNKDLQGQSIFQVIQEVANKAGMIINYDIDDDKFIFKNLDDTTETRTIDDNEVDKGSIVKKLYHDNYIENITIQTPHRQIALNQYGNVLAILHDNSNGVVSVNLEGDWYEKASDIFAVYGVKKTQYELILSGLHWWHMHDTVSWNGSDYKIMDIKQYVGESKQTYLKLRNA